MIAYFILVHRYPNQFKRLFKSIYANENQYLIHVDKRAGKALLQEVKTFLSDYKNTSLLKSQNVVWGGYSMVDVELNGIKELLKINKKWDSYINLSGQDFPLKTQGFINSFLKANKGKDFIKILDQKIDRPNTLNRIQNYFVESTNGFSGKPIKRSYLSNITPYIGGQWKILSRKCCEFIVTSPKVARFRKFYKNTLIPDEGFFQTVLRNTDYRGSIIDDDKRAIIWVPDLPSMITEKNINTTKSLIASGKIKLRPKVFTINDKTFLLKSQALFARKFDETVDNLILNTVELSIKQRTNQKIISGINTVEPFQAMLTLPISQFQPILKNKHPIRENLIIPIPFNPIVVD